MVFPSAKWTQSLKMPRKKMMRERASLGEWGISTELIQLQEHSIKREKLREAWRQEVQDARANCLGSE